VGGQLHAPAALTPRKTRYALYRKLVGPRGQVRKIFLTLKFDPRTIQPVASRYADYSLLTFYNLLVTWCTNRFNIQQLYVLPTLYLCVLYLSDNKQRLVPLTT